MSSSTKPLRVLVVDDSPIMARKICMMMDLIGHQVVRTASSGRGAIVAYRECMPDVVTMDITMPDVDGIEATRVIKTAFPDANIVMVTSQGQEKMVLEALKAGAKGYVIKPFQQQRIFDAIEKACRSVILTDRLDAVSARDTEEGAAGVVDEKSNSEKPTPPATPPTHSA